MARAILKGLKTVTRRPVKPQPEGRPVPMGKDSCWPGYFAVQGTAKVIPAPYQPGDILWVRETWSRMETGQYLYRADKDDPPSYLGWHPSIHMPREAARIFLRVSDVRAERLREITWEDAVKEGCKNPMRFDELWNSTIKPTDRDRYGWEANPWVWVIKFERCRKPDGWPG